MSEITGCDNCPYNTPENTEEDSGECSVEQWGECPVRADRETKKRMNKEGL